MVTNLISDAESWNEENKTINTACLFKKLTREYLNLQLGFWTHYFIEG